MRSNVSLKLDVTKKTDLKWSLFCCDLSVDSLILVFKKICSHLDMLWRESIILKVWCQSLGRLIIIDFVEKSELFMLDAYVFTVHFRPKSYTCTSSGALLGSQEKGMSACLWIPEVLLEELWDLKGQSLCLVFTSWRKKASFPLDLPLLKTSSVTMLLMFLQYFEFSLQRFYVGN